MLSVLLLIFSSAPARASFLDADCDGYGDPDHPSTSTSAGCLSSVGTDCDDSDPSVHPDQAETCEVGDQVDNDCNGDVNSADGYSKLVGWSASSHLMLYVDQDLDAFGDDNVSAVQACALVDGYSVNNTDCDDTDASIHPNADEVCDGIDQDCDRKIDEPDLDPEVSGCEMVYRDLDGDGYGDPNVSECLCVPDGEEAVENPNDDNRTFLLTGGDCYDRDATVHPRSCADGLDNDEDGLSDEGDPDCADGLTEDGAAPEARAEVYDGHDNDCDGLVPAVELDCDDDGHAPTLPVGTLNYGDTYEDASALGLTACGTEGATTSLACWDDTLTLVCGAAGLWQLAYTSREDGRYTGGFRTYDVTRTLRGGDCDDRCESRHPDAVEECDGIDTDCAAAEATEVTAGLPDTLIEGQAPAGWVQEAEADLDGDGLLECDDFSPAAAETEAAPSTCGAPMASAEGDAEAEDTGEDTGEDKEADGCATLSARPGLLGVLSLALVAGLRRRRARQGA